MSTLQELTTQSYDILREADDDVSAYPTSFMHQLLNSAQLRICSGSIKNAQNGERIRKGVLPFLNKRQFVESILSTSITTAPSIGATTLTVAQTTDYPTTGTLWISGNLVTYTGKTSTTFTGCSNVLFPFPAGTRVYPSYTLNTDFMSMVEVSYNNAMPLPYVEDKEVYRNLVPAMKGYRPLDIVQASTSTPIQYTRLAPFYTLWEGKFQPFFVDNTGGMFVLHYEKKPTTMVDDDDETTIDDDTWATSTIPYLAVGEMLFNRGEGDYAMTLLSFAYAQLTEMYAFYNNRGSEDSDGSAVTYDKIFFNV